MNADLIKPGSHSKSSIKFATKFTTDISQKKIECLFTCLETELNLSVDTEKITFPLIFCQSRGFSDSNFCRLENQFKTEHSDVSIMVAAGRLTNHYMKTINLRHSSKPLDEVELDTD